MEFIYLIFSSRGGVLVPGFGRLVLLYQGKMDLARGMATFVQNGYGAFCQPKFWLLRNAVF